MNDRARKGNRMKITDYSTFVLQTPWRNLTYLALETDEGIRGFGEARVVSKTHTVCEYLKDVRRHIVGHDACDIEDLHRRFTLLDFGIPGEVVMTGLALVEMACWDCVGKKANLPVYKLMGGKVRDKIPAYANGWYTVDRTPESFAAAARKVLKRGYRAMKLDPFGNGNLELTREEYFRSLDILEAVFAVAGRENQVFVEMHGRFAPHQAVEIAKAIEKHNPGWIEEPCRPDDPGALDVVARHTTIPIATGERYYTATQFRDLFPRRTDIERARIVRPARLFDPAGIVFFDGFGDFYGLVGREPSVHFHKHLIFATRDRKYRFQNVQTAKIFLTCQFQIAVPEGVELHRPVAALQHFSRGGGKRFGSAVDGVPTV